MDSKLIVPPVVGLVVGSRESKMARLVIQGEAAVSGAGVTRHIERFRMANGRWVAAKTVLSRLAALGFVVEATETGPPGPHTPIY